MLLKANGQQLSNFSQKTEDKEKVSVPYPGYPYGWIGPKKEALAASKEIKPHQT